VKKLIAASLFFLMIALAACSNRIDSNRTAISSTSTDALTNTPFPASKTPDVVGTIVPQGQPASEWQGIPIMPQAIAGEGDEESYVFTIKAMPQQVQDYYQVELGKLGWQPFATENRGSSQLLMFTNATSETLTVSIIAKGEEVLVLLVK
jgi:hypothetical protein